MAKIKMLTIGSTSYELDAYPSPLSSGTDLNTYNADKYIGHYYCAADNVSSLSNCPTESAFSMKLEKCGASYYRQTISPYNDPTWAYCRIYNGSSWGHWDTLDYSNAWAATAGVADEVAYRITTSDIESLFSGLGW